MIIIIMLTLILVLLVICAIVLLLMSNALWFPSIMGAMILLLIIEIIYSKYTNKYLAKERDVQLSYSLSKSMDKDNAVKEIEFIRVDNKWVCKKDENIKFILDGYLFKKAFILSCIVRKTRYATISNQKPMVKLLKKRLKIKGPQDLIVRFIDGEKTKEYWAVKNYVSKHTFLSRAVVYAKGRELLGGNNQKNRLKEIRKLDEIAFLNW
ncbi:MAG: hypothetical protein IKC48_01920 [Clostridia bacterium]|nr:hypothetical protein [Clostridia bacterium]